MKVPIGATAVVTRRDPNCRWHGLPAGFSGHPPLRRHAHDGEDDRQVELRLYHEAMGWPPPPARQTNANSIVRRIYWERAAPVTLLTQWGSKKRRETFGGPRNVLIRRGDGTLVVRPFRGLRRSRP